MVLFQQVDFCVGVNIRILLIVTIVVNWTIELFCNIQYTFRVVSVNSKFNS